MLDFNKRPSMGERINAAVDAALEAERAAAPTRDYLGASRLGHACERALQFEFAGAPKDAGQVFAATEDRQRGQAFVGIPLEPGDIEARKNEREVVGETLDGLAVEELGERTALGDGPRCFGQA